MPSNKAAWLTAVKAPLEVRAAPYTSPCDNEMVIKNGAVAINPVDWMKQEMGDMIFSWIKYPFIMGTDVAGEVVEVGRAVTRFKIGDRVIGHATGMVSSNLSAQSAMASFEGWRKETESSASRCLHVPVSKTALLTMWGEQDKHRNSSAQGGFQEYTVLIAHAASPIPDSLSFENAVVLPLGLSTAACGLFQKDQLALQHPSLRPKPTGKTLLIWGGSTSVGCNAIQLAVAAGYEVITTASPRNFDFVKKLGASLVFDYNSKTVVADLIQAFKGRTIAGALNIGKGSAFSACLNVVDKCKGDKFIAMASYPTPPTPPKRFVLLTTICFYLSGLLFIWYKSRASGIRYKFIFGSTLIDNEVGPAIYEDFLPKALAEGVYIAAPEPQVVGKGLKYIQAGLDLQKKGVSAKKVVVSL